MYVRTYYVDASRQAYVWAGEREVSERVCMWTVVSQGRGVRHAELGPMEVEMKWGTGVAIVAIRNHARPPPSKTLEGW